MASVSETLREALRDCGQSRYAVAKATGIRQSVLSRFANGSHLRGENIDKLAGYLGLELRRGTNEQPPSKTATSGGE